MTTEPKMPEALRLAENALRLQTQYTMQPTLERMGAARRAKESLEAELHRLHERVAELERVLDVGEHEMTTTNDALREALFLAVLQMEMENWHWNSSASTAQKREAHARLQEQYKLLAQQAAPTPQASDFIAKTNREYAAWCATYYQHDSLDHRGMKSLDGLWAWQEQERRMLSASPATPYGTKLKQAENVLRMAREDIEVLSRLANVDHTGPRASVAAINQQLGEK